MKVVSYLPMCQCGPSAVLCASRSLSDPPLPSSSPNRGIFSSTIEFRDEESVNCPLNYFNGFVRSGQVSYNGGRCLTFIFETKPCGSAK